MDLGFESIGAKRRPHRPVRVKGDRPYRVKCETPCPGDMILASYHTGYYLSHFPQNLGSLRSPALREKFEFMREEEEGQ